MSEVKHDPRTKLLIKEGLYDYLYGPVQQKSDRRIKEIIIANTRALASSHQSFIYRNVVYEMDPKVLRPRLMNRLVDALKPDMDEYLQNLEMLNQHEVPHVMGYITQVLNSSDDMQDYFRLLPDIMHPPLQRMIDKCPCRTENLSEEFVTEMQANNQTPIELIKRRLVTNLLIQ